VCGGLGRGAWGGGVTGGCVHMRHVAKTGTPAAVQRLVHVPKSDHRRAATAGSRILQGPLQISIPIIPWAAVQKMAAAHTVRRGATCVSEHTYSGESVISCSWPLFEPWPYPTSGSPRRYCTIH